MRALTFLLFPRDIVRHLGVYCLDICHDRWYTWRSLLEWTKYTKKISIIDEPLSLLVLSIILSRVFPFKLWMDRVVKIEKHHFVIEFLRLIENHSKYVLHGIEMFPLSICVILISFYLLPLSLQSVFSSCKLFIIWPSSGGQSIFF